MTSHLKRYQRMIRMHDQSPYNPLARMRRFLLLLLAMAAGCAPQQEKISEKEVIATVEGFFEALDVENTDPNMLNRYVTGDFMIYEAGQKMDKEAFMEMADGAPILTTDWELGDFRVSSDYHSAHVSLFNRGTFLVQPDTVRMRLHYQWLESAYLVRENDSLKIKFYFSDNIGVKTDTIP